MGTDPYLALTDTYEALADSHHNPGEMRAIEEHCRTTAEAVETLEKPE
jgi:hypothetical protein